MHPAAQSRTQPSQLLRQERQPPRPPSCRCRLSLQRHTGTARWPCNLADHVLCAVCNSVKFCYAQPSARLPYPCLVPSNPAGTASLRQAAGAGRQRCTGCSCCRETAGCRTQEGAGSRACSQISCHHFCQVPLAVQQVPLMCAAPSRSCRIGTEDPSRLLTADQHLPSTLQGN